MLVTLEGMIVFLQPVIRVFVSVSIIALQLFRESYDLFPTSTSIEVRHMHCSKTLSPMLDTLLGIVMEVRLLQPENAKRPMLVTLLGIVIKDKPLQYLKAEPPMLFTLEGMVIEVRPLQA